MLLGEGLDNVFRRHDRHAEAAFQRTALDRFGLSPGQGPASSRDARFTLGTRRPQRTDAGGIEITSH